MNFKNFALGLVFSGCATTALEAKKSPLENPVMDSDLQNIRTIADSISENCKRLIEDGAVNRNPEDKSEIFASSNSKFFEACLISEKIIPTTEKTIKVRKREMSYMPEEKPGLPEKDAMSVTFYRVKSKRGMEIENISYKRKTKVGMERVVFAVNNRGKPFEACKKTIEKTILGTNATLLDKEIPLPCKDVKEVLDGAQKEFEKRKKEAEDDMKRKLYSPTENA